MYEVKSPAQQASPDSVTMATCNQATGHRLLPSIPLTKPEATITQNMKDTDSMSLRECEPLESSVCGGEGGTKAVSPIGQRDARQDTGCTKALLTTNQYGAQQDILCTKALSPTIRQDTVCTKATSLTIRQDIICTKAASPTAQQEEDTTVDVESEEPPQSPSPHLIESQNSSVGGAKPDLSPDAAKATATPVECESGCGKKTSFKNPQSL